MLQLRRILRSVISLNVNLHHPIGPQAFLTHRLTLNLVSLNHGDSSLAISELHFSTASNEVACNSEPNAEHHEHRRESAPRPRTPLESARGHAGNVPGQIAEKEVSERIQSQRIDRVSTKNGNGGPRHTAQRTLKAGCTKQQTVARPHCGPASEGWNVSDTEGRCRSGRENRSTRAGSRTTHAFRPRTSG